MSGPRNASPIESEVLTWDQICARYPDRFVCLVDTVYPENGSPQIVSARVVGHGATRDIAFAPIRYLEKEYPRFSIRYTGVCTAPLIRPALVIDDETLDMLEREAATIKFFPRVSHHA